MKKGVLIGLGVFVIFAILIVSWGIGVWNDYNVKFQTGKAAQLNSTIVFDKTWKVIRDQAHVTEQYKDGFKEIYVGMMDARYSKDGNSGKETLMKWVTESNPTLDASIYKTLMNTIEGSRDEFMVEQKKLIDINRELKAMKIKFWEGFIIGGRPDLDIKLVTSAKTEEAFKSGQDNDDPLAKPKEDKK